MFVCVVLLLLLLLCVCVCATMATPDAVVANTWAEAGLRYTPSDLVGMVSTPAAMFKSVCEWAKSVGGETWARRPQERDGHVWWKHTACGGAGVTPVQAVVRQCVKLYQELDRPPTMLELIAGGKPWQHALYQAVLCGDIIVVSKGRKHNQERRSTVSSIFAYKSFAAVPWSLRSRSTSAATDEDAATRRLFTERVRVHTSSRGVFRVSLAKYSESSPLAVVSLAPLASSRSRKCQFFSGSTVYIEVKRVAPQRGSGSTKRGRKGSVCEGASGCILGFHDNLETVAKGAGGYHFPIHPTNEAGKVLPVTTSTLPAGSPLSVSVSSTSSLVTALVDLAKARVGTAVAVARFSSGDALSLLASVATRCVAPHGFDTNDVFSAFLVQESKDRLARQKGQRALAVASAGGGGGAGGDAGASVGAGAIAGRGVPSDTVGAMDEETIRKHVKEVRIREKAQNAVRMCVLSNSDACLARARKRQCQRVHHHEGAGAGAGAGASAGAGDVKPPSTPSGVEEVFWQAGIPRYLPDPLSSDREIRSRIPKYKSLHGILKGWIKAAKQRSTKPGQDRAAWKLARGIR